MKGCIKHGRDYGVDRTCEECRKALSADTIRLMGAMRKLFVEEHPIAAIGAMQGLIGSVTGIVSGAQSATAVIIVAAAVEKRSPVEILNVVTSLILTQASEQGDTLALEALDQLADIHIRDGLAPIVPVPGSRAPKERNRE